MKTVKVKESRPITHAFAWESMPGVYQVTYYPAFVVDKGQYERDLIALADRGIKVVVTRNFISPGEYDIVRDETGKGWRWAKRPPLPPAFEKTA